MEAHQPTTPWKKWGPYLSERQWGTVREDYGDGGDTWNHFSHDQARSRAYRWGEDGLAGICDDRQMLCFALALWNGNDPILKERLFGLTNSEGNHGEDVKEYYFYLDSTPTHSYIKYLYKYPQAAFPYADLVAGNKSRARLEPEYELLDTGVFDDDRYFDVFVEGGFLGLDNIGVFDRSAPLPSGGRLEQADGTAWMAFYCQTMLQLALELALHDPVYQKLAAKFYEHFLWIAGAMDHGGGQVDLWDEDDGFFYDLLRLPTGSAVRLKVRSMVGLLSLCASTVFPPIVESRLPVLMARVRDFTRCHPHLVARIASPGRLGYREGRLLGLLPDDKLRRVLRYMLDESEFLSPFGIRAVSKIHRDHPYAFAIEGQTYRVDYEPAESTSGMFGGNSNWRGPIWLPMNILLIRGLLNLYAFYGKSFTVECPTGSERSMTLFEVAHEIGRRITRIFLRDEQGGRPVHGGAKKFQGDRYWRDLILFYEYFHGDNGAGIGASHQTGWTGLVAPLMHLFGSFSAESMLETLGKAVDTR